MGEIRKENLHQSLIEYLDGLGLTEEQVQGLINSGLVDVNTDITNMKNDMVNMQKFKLTKDNGYNKSITSGSFNDIVTPGIYTISNEVTDGPFSGYGGWYHLEVIADSNLWVKQTATIFETTGYGTKMYIRGMQNGTWAPWREFIDSAQLNNVQTHKLSDNSGFCRNLGACNWNDVNTCGYYMGSNTTNAPENSADWFMVQVIAHNGIWCEQIATAFATTQKRYIRYQTNGSWTAWRSL